MILMSVCVSVCDVGTHTHKFKSTLKRRNLRNTWKKHIFSLTNPSHYSTNTQTNLGSFILFTVNDLLSESQVHAGKIQNWMFCVNLCLKTTWIKSKIPCFYCQDVFAAIAITSLNKASNKLVFAKGIFLSTARPLSFRERWVIGVNYFADPLGFVLVLIWPNCKLNLP